MLVAVMNSAPTAIRVATSADAEQIANIHVLAWGWAYCGQVPDSFLASLSVYDRIQAWRSSLDHPGWVACLGSGSRGARYRFRIGRSMSRRGRGAGDGRGLRDLHRAQPGEYWPRPTTIRDRDALVADQRIPARDSVGACLQQQVATLI